MLFKECKKTLYIWCDWHYSTYQRVYMETKIIFHVLYLGDNLAFGSCRWPSSIQEWGGWLLLVWCLSCTSWTISRAGSRSLWPFMLMMASMWQWWLSSYWTCSNMTHDTKMQQNKQFRYTNSQNTFACVLQMSLLMLQAEEPRAQQYFMFIKSPLKINLGRSQLSTLLYLMFNSQKLTLLLARVLTVSVRVQYRCFRKWMKVSLTTFLLYSLK